MICHLLRCIADVTADVTTAQETEGKLVKSFTVLMFIRPIHTLKDSQSRSHFEGLKKGRN